MIKVEQIMIQKTSNDTGLTKWMMNVAVEHKLRTSI
jgi:hypothetical protein